MSNASAPRRNRRGPGPLTNLMLRVLRDAAGRETGAVSLMFVSQKGKVAFAESLTRRGLVEPYVIDKASFGLRITDKGRGALEMVGQ